MGTLPLQGLVVPVTRRQDSIPQEHRREGEVETGVLGSTCPLLTLPIHTPLTGRGANREVAWEG